MSDMIGKKQCLIKRYISEGPDPTVSLTSFDCGYLNANDSQNIETEVLREVKHPTNYVQLVSRKNQVYSGSPSSESYCNTFLLVVDKSGEGTLLPTTSCRLRNCSNQIAPKRKLDEAAALDSADISKFGSRKYQRAVNTTNKLRETKAVTSLALEKSLRDIDGSELDVMNVSNAGEASGKNMMLTVLPPCNREAVDVEDVYPVSGILDSKDLTELEGSARFYLDPPEDPARDQTFLVHPFYKDIKEKTLLKMQLLLYANSVLTFTRMSGWDVKKKDAASAVCPHSTSVGRKILDAFTTTSGSTRMKVQNLTDKAICHAMVAILLASGFRLQYEWFFGCLKGVRSNQLKSLMKLVGLQAASKLGAKYHVLKVPLPPIQVAKPPRKKSNK